MIKKEDIIALIKNPENYNKKGIYKIYYKNSPRVYIGSTCESFIQRFRRHLNNLINNNHCNIKLSRVFKKHKEVKFEIIEVIEDLTTILDREQYWIDYYNSFNNGLNSCKNASNTLGFKMSQSSIDKISSPILQYDLNGNFIKEWRSITKAHKELGYFNYSAFKNNNSLGMGFLWRKKTENYPLQIQAYKNPVKKRILQYSSKGEFIKEWPSLLEASKGLNIPVGNISKALTKKILLAYGFIWENYIENYPKQLECYIRKHKNQKFIKAIDEDNNILGIYDSLRNMEIIYSCARATLSKSLKDNVFVKIRKMNKNIKLIEISSKDYKHQLNNTLN